MFVFRHKEINIQIQKKSIIQPYNYDFYHISVAIQLKKARKTKKNSKKFCKFQKKQ